MCYAVDMKSEQWREAFKALPPGLTMDELAARLSCQRTTAFKQAKLCGYAMGNGVELKWNIERVKNGLEKQWAGIDWRKSDIKIAKKLKRSRQWVFQLRRKRTALRNPRWPKKLKPLLDNKLAA